MIREKVSKAELSRRLAGARLLTLDVDGVLTDGTLYFQEDGRELRVFNVHDGTGIKLVLQAGLPVAIITASTTPSIVARGRNLGVPHVHTGISDKVRVMEDLCARFGATPAEVVHMGDDVNDIPILERVGVPITVADARPEVVARVLHVTDRPGGRGAVREVCDMILKARGAWPY